MRVINLLLYVSLSSLTLGVGCDADQSVNPSTSGEFKGGEVMGGEVIGGEVMGGEVMGGEVIGGEIIGGEITGGDTVGGEITGGEAPAGEMIEPSRPRQVTTSLGVIEGGLHETSYGSALGFLGVPYAAPPVDELRLRPPAPPQGWDGVRDATQFSANCPQGGRLLGALFNDEVPQSEDCLYLNIWAPASANSEMIDLTTPRPVMVWIHGGGFIQGSGSFELYDGARLATRGDLIVVTINYRLGVLGFLNTKRLEVDVAQDQPSAHQIGNFGIQDQIAALRWIQRHIGRFGGDPERVTIFGESAGGFSICALLASPPARDLFHGAIIQSGGGCGGFPELGEDLESPEELKAEALLDALGCSGEGAELHQCLNARSVDELMMAGSAASQSILGLDDLGPVTDGELIKGSARALISSGELRDLPVIIGSNADEMTLFTFNQPLNLMSYERFLTGTFGAYSDDLATLYPATDDRSARDSYNALLSDLLFICPTLSFAAETSTASSGGIPPAERSKWVYHFTHRLTSGVPAVLGATHALEIPFVFNNTHIELFGASATEADQQLSAHIADAWISFAHDGSPTAWPEWTPYRDARDPGDGPNGEERSFDEGAVAILGVPVEVTQTPLRDGRCASLAQLGFAQLW